MSVVIYILAVIVTVVGVDVAFLRHDVLERFVVNIAIVLVFLAFYLRFLKKP